MATRLYKIYSESEYSSLDYSEFTSNHRWNLDQTEVVLEFINIPEDMTGVLNEEEARQITSTSLWGDQSIEI